MAGSEEKATLIARRRDSLVRFRWEADENDKYFFEIKVEQDELTGDVSLVVTDFAYPEETSDARQLWDNSVTNLRKVIGA